MPVSLEAVLGQLEHLLQGDAQALNINLPPGQLFFGSLQLDGQVTLLLSGYVIGHCSSHGLLSPLVPTLPQFSDTGSQAPLFLFGLGGVSFQVGLEAFGQEGADLWFQPLSVPVLDHSLFNLGGRQMRQAAERATLMLAEAEEILVATAIAS
ncbi:MAG: hypothetical protein ACRDJK_01970 [Actinomycetota bacterium]